MCWISSESNVGRQTQDVAWKNALDLFRFKRWPTNSECPMETCAGSLQIEMWAKQSKSSGRTLENRNWDCAEMIITAIVFVPLF